jgi:hypothetical protein
MATYDSETDETFIADSDEHEDDDYFNEIYDSNENLNDDELIFSDDSDIELEENFDFDKFTINLNDDNKVFLMKIQILLKKVRTLIKTVKNSNVILSYLIEKLKVVLFDFGSFRQSIVESSIDFDNRLKSISFDFSKKKFKN